MKLSNIFCNTLIDLNISRNNGVPTNRSVKQVNVCDRFIDPIVIIIEEYPG
jgi:hypothetical protein